MYFEHAPRRKNIIPDILMYFLTMQNFFRLGICTLNGITYMCGSSRDDDFEVFIWFVGNEKTRILENCRNASQNQGSESGNRRPCRPAFNLGDSRTVCVCVCVGGEFNSKDEQQSRSM